MAEDVGFNEYEQELILLAQRLSKLAKNTQKANQGAYANQEEEKKIEIEITKQVNAANAYKVGLADDVSRKKKRLVGASVGAPLLDNAEEKEAEKEENIYFGLGWIAHFAKTFIPEYVFCMSTEFKVWSGDCSKSVSFEFEHHYDPSQFGSNLNRRIAYYEFNYTILPVNKDSFIFWIRGDADRFGEELLPIVERLVFVSHNNAKEIAKPAGLVFWDYYINKYDMAYGFALHDTEEYRQWSTLSLFKWAYDTRLTVPGSRNYESPEFPTCGLSDKDNFYAFGVTSFESIDGGLFAYGPSEDGLGTLMGSPYVYVEALGPQGDPEAAIGSSKYLGMESPPIRLSVNTETSAWASKPACGSPTNFFITNIDYNPGPGLPPSTETYYFDAYPDGAYGYVSTPPTGKSYEIQYAVSNPYFSNGEKWWEDIVLWQSFYPEEMDSKHWKTAKFKLSTNQKIVDEITIWADSVLNEGFTEEYYGVPKAAFAPIFSNPWGRDWTQTLIGLGFSEQDLK
jgi:hypothetical protein